MNGELIKTHAAYDCVCHDIWIHIIHTEIQSNTFFKQELCDGPTPRMRALSFNGVSWT